jgi:predicted metalloprotease with PDZ domain
MEGLRVNAKDLETRLTMYRPGETVTLHVFRRDELLQMPVILQAAEADTCVLRIGKEGLTDLGKNWLGLPVA